MLGCRPERFIANVRTVEAGLQVDLMPLNDARRAEIAAAIDAYNQRRKVLLEEMRRQRRIVIPAWLLACAGITAVTWRYAGFGLVLFVLFGLCFEGKVLLDKWTRRTTRRFFDIECRSLFPSMFPAADEFSVGYGICPPTLEDLPGYYLIPRNAAVYRLSISGRQEDLRFTVCECDLKLPRGDNDDVVPFSGYIVAVTLLQPVQGQFAALTWDEAFWPEATKPEKLPDPLVEVRTALPNVTPAHRYYADGPNAAARRLGGMIDAVRLAGDRWAEPVRIAVRGDDGFLLRPCKARVFDFPSILQELDHDTHIVPMIRELEMLLPVARSISRI